MSPAPSRSSVSRLSVPAVILSAALILTGLSPAVAAPTSLLEPVSAIVAGENYVIANGDPATTAVALSAQPEADTGTAVAVSNAEVPPAAVWKAVTVAGGVALESAAERRADRYLTLAFVDGAPRIVLGAAQALTLTEVDGVQRVGAAVDGRELAVTLAEGRYRAVDLEAEPGASTGSLLRYTGVEYLGTDQVMSGETLTGGSEYVIALGGVHNPAGTGFSGYGNHFVQSAPVAETAGVLGARNQFAETSATTASLPLSTRWVLEEASAGHALRAVDGSGYLGLGAGGAVLASAPQVLSITPTTGNRMTITAEVEGVHYRLAWNGTPAGFTATTEASPNAAFAVSERRWSLQPLSPIRTVPFSAIEEGGIYVFGAIGTYVVGQSAGTIALAGEGNGSASAQLMRGDRFVSMRASAPNALQWRVEKYGAGHALQSLQHPGQYLNLAGGSALLGPKQALDLIAGSNETVKISALTGGNRYFIRFTAGNGGGWQSATPDSSNAFTLFSAPLEGADPLPPYVADDGTSDFLTEVDAAEITSGRNYVFAMPGIGSSDKGTGTFALSSLDGDGSAALREHIPFVDTADAASSDIVFKARSFGEGFSLETSAVDGPARFLRVDVVGGQASLALGARQELQLEPVGGTARVGRSIDGTSYFARFTNGNGGGWQAGTSTSSAAFTVYEYSAPEHSLSGLVDARDVVSGGEYSLILGGVLNPAGTGWAQYAPYALTGSMLEGTDALRATPGPSVDSGLPEGQRWIIERFEGGYSLRASGVLGAAQYLRIAGDSAVELSVTPQALTLERRVDGFVRIMTADGRTKLAYQALPSPSFAAVVSGNNDRFSVWEHRWSLEASDTPRRVERATIESGQSYVFSAPNTFVIGEQYATSAIIGEGNGNVKVGLMASAAFGLTDAHAPAEHQWVVEAYDGGHSLRSLARPGDDGYLTITVVDGVAHAALGARQALDLEANGMDTRITRVIDGTRYYLRYTAGGGGGWQASTSSGSSTFRIYQTAVSPEPPAANPLEKVDAVELSTEGSWAFVLPGAAGADTAGALSGGARQGADPAQLTVEAFDQAAENISPWLRWNLSRLGSGYALSTEAVTGRSGFLTLGEGLALGTARELRLDVSVDGTVRILTELGGEVVGVGLVDGAWGLVPAASAAAFATYRINIARGQVPDEPIEREDPLFTIATMSDSHIDYDLQFLDDPIRPTTRAAVERIRTEQKPDLVLNPGDTVSDHNLDDWSYANWENVTQNLVELYGSVSPSGRVAHVNGNHDYEVGELEWNSGAWIDAANLAGSGDYRDVLYEGPERDNNLAAYQYELDGVNVLALNTPYNGDESIRSYLYTIEQIEWMERKLAEVDPESFTVVLTHYPLRDHRGGTGTGYGLSDANGADTRLKQAMLAHPNLLHVYGHDHGGPIVEADTWEKVTHYNSDGTVSEVRDLRAGGFTSAFAGSFSHYNNRFNPGALGAEQPKIVQSLLVYLYEDRVELQYVNYGEEQGERRYPYGYVLPLVKTITSDSVEVSGGGLRGVSHGTTAEQLLAQLDNPGELRVLDFGGAEASAQRIVRTGFTVERRASSGSLLDEVTVTVDRAAASSHPWTVDTVHLLDSAGGEVYALRDAARITGATATNTGGTGGILVVGVYDAQGSYLDSVTAPITASGRVDLDLDVSGYGAEAHTRAYIVDSMTAAAPLSEPLVSTGEKPLAANIPTSIATELVIGADQTDNELTVLRPDAPAWDDPSAVAWSWKPTAENGFGTTRTSYTAVTDAKLRWSDYYGGYVVVTTASGGFVGLFDYASGEKLFERTGPKVENNPHSVEVLPDGNIVAASSTGGTVTIYAATQGEGDGWYQQYEHLDAHALVWDPDRNVLWSAGHDIVQGWEIGGSREEPTLVKRDDLRYVMPEAGAHDMSPVYGQPDRFWLSGSEHIWQFDAATGSFDNTFAGYELLDADSHHGVKGIGSQPFSGDVVRIHPNYDIHAWNSDSIRLHRNTEAGYVLEEQFFASDLYYKARSWYPRYE